MQSFALKARVKRPGFLANEIQNVILSQETIDPQSDDFGMKIEQILQAIYQDGLELQKSSTHAVITEEDVKFDKKFSALIREKKYDEELSKLIFNRLGIKTRVVLNEYTHGAMAVMPINEHHIFIDKIFRNHDYYIKQVKSADIKELEKGSIDLNKAKVSGMFSKYIHSLYISFFINFFIDKLTPAEVTGIILHELGHAFTFYEYSARLNETNQVMSNVARELLKPEDKRDTSYVYQTFKNVDSITDEEIDDLINSKDQTVMGNKLAVFFIMYYFSETKTDTYGKTSAEQLADQFATRFGYGRPLLLALDKISKDYDPERSSAVRKVLMATQIATLTALSIVTIAGVVFPVISAISAFIIYSLIRSSGDDVRPMNYDDLTARYKRIRSDIIQQLKSKELTKEDTQSLIDSIQSIDLIISEMRPFSGLFRSLANFLFSSAKQSNRDIEYQKLMESLASSDLFVKSAELAQLK